MRQPIAVLLTLLTATAASADQYQVQPQFMPLVTPGTVIGQRAASPWTHLIVKSHPKCTRGDVQQVAKSNVELAGLLTTSLLAEVKRVAGPNNQPQYILNQIAGAVSKSIEGRDVAITPDTQKRLGAQLGFMQGILLKEFVSEQKTVTIKVRSATMAIFDTPIVLRVDNRNQSMVLRYAVLVDSRTGDLNTLCWPIKLAGKKYAGVAGPMQWLPKDHVIECILHVDASEYTFGIPSKRAFGCVSVPRGHVQVNLPANVGALMSKEFLTSQECPQAQQWLVQVVQRAQEARRNSPKNGAAR